MSFEDPANNIVEDVAKGTVKGVLEFGKEELLSFIKKLRNRGLGFIGNGETIEIAREQYKSGESKFYHIYIEDKELLRLVGMGLTLRKVEGIVEKRTNLRNKIFEKYKVNGLHIAEFVQNGILNRYIGILVEELKSIKDLKEQIEEVLNNIEKHTLFIKGTDTLGEIIKKSSIIVHAHSPNVFIISGEGPAANLIKVNVEKIKSVFKDYVHEEISMANKETLFFRKILFDS